MRLSCKKSTEKPIYPTTYRLEPVEVGACLTKTYQDSKDDSDADRGDSKRAPMHPVEAVDIAAAQGAIDRGRVKVVIHGGGGSFEIVRH